jgi:threonyl-tRNA synthetase
VIGKDEGVVSEPEPAESEPNSSGAAATQSDAQMITVEVTGRGSVQVTEGSTVATALKGGPKRAKDDRVMAAVLDGAAVDLGRTLAEGDTVEFVGASSDLGRSIIRHSTAHVMAQAVTRLWPGAHFAIGPVIEGGFYYDFELPGGAHFSDEDLSRIDSEMRRIIKENQPFDREEHDAKESRQIFADQPFKIEIIETVESGGRAGADPELTTEAGDGNVVSTYRNTPSFIDLCRGPHVPSTGYLGHFRLQRVAGAYWRGDEKREQLQRIYGTAWESDAALKEHIRRLEEAERRDHRRLGLELDLFSFPPEIGSGLAVFHPKGGIIRREMEDYARRRHDAAGYQFVNTPHLAKSDLFQTSGHLDWYADGMYPPMELDEGHRYYVKPMNCPFHILIYRSRQRSYRELPMRLFEFGSVYRYEKSGVVHGLTRVRGMTQDDSHIFCTPDQMPAELESLLQFVLGLLRDYGLEDFYLELSTKPEVKAVGSDDEWDIATEALRQAATAMGLDLVLDEGGGAFYGPKISVQARDAIGRHWQVSTIQLDFQEPQRFGLEFVGPDNARHRPVMIHRALFGSVERFFAILLEHYAGAMPTWLSPVQVAVLPVADRHEEYADRIVKLCREAGLRAESDSGSESVKARIRDRRLQKVPYVLVVGDDDVESETVGVNRRGNPVPERGVQVARFIEDLAEEVAERGSPERRAT